MKTLFLGIATGLFISASAFARDSTCLLGDDGKIAITTLEHRASDGRATNVTLIFGEHFLKGELKNKDSGKITLSEFGTKQYKTTDKHYKDNYVFKGSVSVDYTKSKIALKGTLLLSADADNTQNINTAVHGKQLNPN